MAGNQIMMYEGYESGFGDFGGRRRKRRSSGGRKRRSSARQKANQARFAKASRECIKEQDTWGGMGRCMRQKLKKGRR